MFENIRRREQGSACLFLNDVRGVGGGVENEGTELPAGAGWGGGGLKSLEVQGQHVHT